jgi:hypothetical protein
MYIRLSLHHSQERRAEEEGLDRLFTGVDIVIEDLTPLRAAASAISRGVDEDELARC